MSEVVKPAKINVSLTIYGFQMHLCYFDENKHFEGNPYFFIGGLLIPDVKAIEFENTLSQIAFNFFGSRTLTQQNEIHGKDIFHGKKNAKGRKLEERVQVFKDITNFLISNKIPIRVICINVIEHKAKYFYAMPPYRLGLMLMLERFCGYLDKVKDIGLVFGDYEADEVTNAVVDFSEYKTQGKTPMYYGRPLGRLLDTVYFTQSHHSRFLQVADLIVYMAGRYENSKSPATSWHEIEIEDCWKKIKASNEFLIQRWP